MAPVLIVDDDEDVRFILVSCLESQYEVLTASNAFEALKIFRDTEISLVITDLRMPRADGGLLISLIREIRPRVPIIAVTAYFDSLTQDRQKLLSQVNYLLEKPFMAKEILERTVELIGPPPGAPGSMPSTVEEWKKLQHLLGNDLLPPPPDRPVAERLADAARRRREIVRH